MCNPRAAAIRREQFLPLNEEKKRIILTALKKHRIGLNKRLEVITHNAKPDTAINLEKDLKITEHLILFLE